MIFVEWILEYRDINELDGLEGSVRGWLNRHFFNFGQRRKRLVAQDLTKDSMLAVQMPCLAKGDETIKTSKSTESKLGRLETGMRTIGTRLCLVHGWPWTNHLSFHDGARPLGRIRR